MNIIDRPLSWGQYTALLFTILALIAAVVMLVGGA